MKYFILFLCFWGILTLNSSAQTWIFQSGTVGFTIKNAGLKVNGSFSGLKAKAEFDPQNPGKTVLEGQVETKTIETGINLRNKHLKKEEYFNVEKFPQINMKLTRMDGMGNTLKGTFTLEIKGVSKTLTIPVVFQTNASGSVLSTSFTINRLDFGVGESSWTMADEVQVHIQFQLIKK
jgi:polyisoprenoid-binding protein YceI